MGTAASTVAPGAVASDPATSTSGAEVGSAPALPEGVSTRSRGRVLPGSPRSRGVGGGGANDHSRRSAVTLSTPTGDEMSLRGSHRQRSNKLRSLRTDTATSVDAHHSLSRPAHGKPGHDSTQSGARRTHSSALPRGQVAPSPSHFNLSQVTLADDPKGTASHTTKSERSSSPTTVTTMGSFIASTVQPYGARYPPFVTLASGGGERTASPQTVRTWSEAGSTTEPSVAGSVHSGLGSLR